MPTQSIKTLTYLLKENKKMLEKMAAATNAGLNTNSTTIAPARELYSNIDFKDMDTKKKDFLEKIVIELEQAQIFDFSSKYRYIKVGLILIRAKKELDLKGKEWKEFYELLGLKEKVEERCRKIAANEWFATLEPEDAYKLSHLTQANMITMSKEKDEEKFQEMLNNSNYDFSVPKTPEVTDEEVAEAFRTAYKKAELESISLEDYKEYCGSSISELIDILDKTLSQINDVTENDKTTVVSAQLEKQHIDESQSSNKTGEKV